MDSQSVLQYLQKKLEETRANLEKRTERRDKLNEEIKEIQQHVLFLQNLIETALSDFNVDKRDFAKISELEGKERQFAKGKQTISDIVYDILKEENGELHVQEITKRAQERYHFDAQRPATSISSALMKHKEKFESIRRGIWKIRNGNKRENQPVDTNNVAGKETDQLQIDIRS